MSITYSSNKGLGTITQIEKIKNFQISVRKE